MTSVVQRSPTDAYAAMWRYMARVRAGRPDAAAELETAAAKLKQDQWPFPAVELLLGRKTPEAVLAAAAKPDDRCEAQFYIGMWHALRGDRKAAAEPLKAALETCPKSFVEYLGAKVELARVGP